ncbi:MAG: penicillin-binding protein [Lachnospiraceae bacterium]|nr:penicillin-binding protein [Lachnospiraceae bacterium]
MFNEIKDFIKNIIVSRLFLLLCIIVVLFFVLIRRLFVLQIINGEEYLNNFTLKIKKEITLDSARGKIYDRNGKLLAYNELAYSVTVEDNYESSSNKNSNLNSTILKAIEIIEKNGDSVINDFNIVLDEDGNYEYTLTGTRLVRFLADIYGYKNTDDLSVHERNSTPKDIIDLLCSRERYGIGDYEYNDQGVRVFVPGKGLTDEEILKIITVRYTMSTTSYQKYLATVIADDVSQETVAAIMENKSKLQGIDIKENLMRRYNDSEYMGHILGYVGNASTEDLEELKESKHEYTMTDTVGKAGIEKTMEEQLQGTKGKDVVFTDNVGKILETSTHLDPVAGNDIYLSIDSELQSAVYNMLEQKLAGILVSKIVNSKTYDNSEVKSSLMMIPIDDVYYALINNNVIDIKKFAEEDAHVYEREVQAAFLVKQEDAINQIRNELLNGNTPYKELTQEYQVYESYIVSHLNTSNLGVIISSEVDKEDQTYVSWAIDETISLKEYLNYCLSQNWIDITKFTTEKQYSDTGEIYEKLVDFICDELRDDNMFSKKLYKYMIKDNMVSGKQICMILFEQNVIYATAGEKNEVESGVKTPYDYIINKISNIEITPSQLALDPCSGSCVVMNMSGEVLACVTYPGFDANRLTNTIDSDYYAKLMLDLSSPMYNNATQQMTAPGSTFKMVSAVTGLEEGVINVGETIRCDGKYKIESLDIEKTCWAYPAAHGNLDVMHAIENSCNSFFYEVGYRLATNGKTTSYDESGGLEKLKKYADMFGLTEKTGIEMEENEPKFSDTLPIDSAIGQGSHNYTTIGIARYVNTIANGGICYKLTLISKVTKPDGTVIEEVKPRVRNIIDIQGSTWNNIKSGMRLVALKTASLRNINLSIAGKTGTAQSSKSRTNHALFVGYAPYEDPELSLAIRIAYGYTSANAASLGGDIFKYYFKLEDEETLLSGVADSNTTEIVED